MKDNRDPQLLGEEVLALRDSTSAPDSVKLSEIVDAVRPRWLESVPDVDGSGPMSADPAQHHSKTPQTEDLQ